MKKIKNISLIVLMLFLRFTFISKLHFILFDKCKRLFTFPRRESGIDTLKGLQNRG